MTRQPLAPIMILASTIAAIAAPVEADPASKQLQVYPKNLARQHLGANLFVFDAGSQSYRPTEAAAAWLDDDITTGWAAMAGKQSYLIALPEPEVVTNFSLSTRPSQGTVSIFGSDEAALPGAKAWVPLVRDVPLESVNEKKLARPFSRLTKYLLVETNIPEPGPVYSLYLFGERPATAYKLVKRDQPIDVKALFGPYSNDPTAFNEAALYAGSRVAFATGGGNYTGWQKAIDENPESGITIAPTKDDAGMALAFAEPQTVTRMAMLANSGAKGKLEVFLVPALPNHAPVAVVAPAEDVQAVANAAPAVTSPISQGASVAGLTPAATFAFDGTNTRLNADLANASGGAALFRWVPDNGTDSLTIREFNAFTGKSLSEYGVQMTPEAIAELASNSDFKDFKDGKALEPVKELLPIGEGFNRKPPYLPPSLGFPPAIPPRVPPRVPPQLPPELSE